MTCDFTSLIILRVEHKSDGCMTNLNAVLMALLGLMSKFLDILPSCQTTSELYPSFFTASQSAYTWRTEPKFLRLVRLTIAMFFSVLSTNAKKNELTHEISNLETQLAVAESENTRINSELDALVSMSMIDKYAVEELGMSKVKSNQIVYVNVSEYKQQRQIAMEKLMAETGK